MAAYFAVAKLGCKPNSTKTMTDNDTATPMLRWMRQATDAQREQLATLANTTRGYLYQLSSERGGRGKQISAKLAFALEDGMKVIEGETKGALPALTAREIAAMWEA